MTIKQNKKSSRAACMSRLLGSASFVALVSFSPALAQDVNITVDRVQTAPASAFTAANVTGFETVSVNTQDSRAAIEATIASGQLDSNVAGSGSSAVAIESNQLSATASGNVFTLSAQQLGSSGNGTAGTLAALSGQFADGKVTTSIAASGLTINGTSDAADTSMAASNNAITATTTVNNATAVFSDDISADLAGNLAQANAGFITSPITLTGGDLTAQELLSVQGGGSVVASTQAIAGAGVDSVATIRGSSILVSVDFYNATDSALSIDGNDIRAYLTGNRASTGTDVTVDTTFDNTAAVLTQQQIGDTVNGVDLISTAESSTLQITLGNSTDSSLTVSSNNIGAQANGNVATLSGTGASGTVADGTFLRIDANTILSDTGVSAVNNNLDSVVTFDDGVGGAPTFGFVAGSQQFITNDGGAGIEASSDGILMAVFASSPPPGGDLLRSSISVEDNTAFALASGNTGGTAIDLTATSITASAGLASDQTIDSTDVTALLGDTSAFRLSLSAFGDVTSSSIMLDNNLSVAEASGNTGQTLLSADADTALLSSSDLDRGTSLIDLDDPDFSATADFALLANQEIDTSVIGAIAASTLRATVGGGLPDDAGAIDASTISLSSNAQKATTSGNTLTNGIALSGNVIGEANATFADSNSVVSSLTSLQDINSATSASSTTTLSLTQADFAAADTTSINASSLMIDANENRSSTTANRVTNTLAVTADTAIIGADAGAALASIDPTPAPIMSAAGTSSLANTQLSTGSAVTATTVADADITAGGANATVASLAGSSASIADNITTASGASNIGTSNVTLNAGTEITSNGALASFQDSTAAVTVTSTFDAENTDTAGEGILLTGAVTASTVGIDNNVTVASGMGNQTANTLSVTATTIDRSASIATGDSDQFFTGATVAQVESDFALQNLQAQTGNISSTGVTGGSINIETATGFAPNMENSSATLNGNQLQSDAMSNLATNRIALNGSAAITETTTGLASDQSSGTAPATPITVGSSSTATFDYQQNSNTSGVTDSTIAIDGNQAFDTATSNRATNTLSLAGNAISGEAANLAAVGVTSTPQGSQLLADNTLSNVQTSVASVSSNAQLDGTAFTGGRDFTDSSLSISDNFARSFGMGNDAANVLSLLADTSAAGAAALSGTQVQIGNVSATADVTASLSTVEGASSNGTATDSSLATDGNIGFARAMGNNQSTTLSIAGSQIDGVSTAGDNASITALGDLFATNRIFVGDNIVTAFQDLTGDVSGTASVTTDILTGNSNVGSSASASQNIAQSNVIGNAGNNLLSLAADTDVTGVSVLASEQNGGATSDVTSAANLDFTIDLFNRAGGSLVDNSTLNVDDNLGFATAFGNDVANRLTVSGTSVTGQENAALSSVDISGGVVPTIAIGTISGASDNLLGNFQTRTGGQVVTSSASLTADLLATPSQAGDAIRGSSATLNGNTLDSTATSNRANNTLVLNAATGLTSGGAIANQQNSDSAVTSNVTLIGSFGSAAFTDATNASIAMLDNTGIARAAGNDAVNVLNASGGTAINGLFAGTGGATVGVANPGALNATGTFASASNQVNSGAVTAQASFVAGATSKSDLSVQTAALNSSSVDLSGNRLLADAVSNRVVNSMTVSGRSPSTDVSTALTTRQVATGPVTSRVDSFRVASTNSALDSSSVGMNGNVFSASSAGNIATSRLVRD